MLEALRGLVVFAELADSMSFTRAGERLGMTRSAVSKHVARLEAQLGAQLLTRTTRKLSLTAAGERVQPLARQIAESVELSQEAARCGSEAMTGQLRIAAPAQLGRSYLTELVIRFLVEHPTLSAELVLGDAFIDLVAERVDVALRVGRFKDSSLRSRQVAKVEAVLCASPLYLRQHGAPKNPLELGQHEWIGHLPNSTQNRITFQRGGRSVLVRVAGRFVCNDGAAAVEACLQGFGVLLVPSFEVAEHVRAGRLVRVLAGWSLGSFTLYAVYPPTRHVPSRLRAFLDYVVEAWRSPPWRLT
jgi:DNA-binding transcriptional LysR family regulator